MSDYQDILYDVDSGIATITINRPEKYNAFRGQTVEDLIAALNRALDSPSGRGRITVDGVR